MFAFNFYTHRRAGRKPLESHRVPMWLHLLFLLHEAVNRGLKCCFLSVHIYIYSVFYRERIDIQHAPLFDTSIVW